MDIPVTPELRAVCRAILAEGRSLQEWRDAESDDAYQVDPYHGGFEAIEDAFCFSLYTPDGRELWFQFTLAEAEEIAAGRLERLPARPAER